MVKLTDKYLGASTLLNLKKLNFEVTDSGRFEAMPQADGTTKEKFIITVKLSDETIIDWIPNESSKKTLRGALGDDTEQWIGKGGIFEIVKMNVRGEMRDVIFVKKDG